MACGKEDFEIKGLQCIGCYGVNGRYCVTLDINNHDTWEAVITKNPLVLDVLAELFIHIEDVMAGPEMKEAVWNYSIDDPKCHRLAKRTLQSPYSVGQEKIWAEKVLNGQEPRRQIYGNQESKKKAKDNSGFIYILSGGGYHKIGLTTNVTRRISEIEPKLPFPTESVHTIHVKDMHIAEEYLHEKFASKRTNGEWFKLDDADIAWIKKWNGQHEQ